MILREDTGIIFRGRSDSGKFNHEYKQAVNIISTICEEVRAEFNPQYLFFMCLAHSELINNSCYVITL